MKLTRSTKIYDLSGRKIARELGGGGCSKVFMMDLGGPQVTVKIPREGIETKSGIILDRIYRATYKWLSDRERESVVFPLGLGRYHDRIALMLKYIPGKSLEAMLSDQDRQLGAVALPQAVSLVLSVLYGLEELAQINVHHADISPANIIIPKASRKAMLIDPDLGIGFADKILFEPIWGTPGYRAPEQSLPPSDPACPGTPSFATDIFSVGIVFAQMLMGHHPFSGNEGLEQQARIDGLEKIGFPHIQLKSGEAARETEINRIIRNMCAVSPGERYTTPDEALRELKHFGNALGYL